MSEEVLTAGMLDSLQRTRPWVRFLSILGFLIVGMMILIGLGVVGFGVYEVMNHRFHFEGLPAIVLGALYLGLSILYIFPSLYLSRYATAITDALQSPQKSEAVERALRNQKSFWKFAGIMTLVTLLLYIPGILAAIAIPNFISATQRAKQKRTMADVRSISTAVEAYATDNNYYPNAKDIGELSKFLSPVYMKDLPPNDAWGQRYLYEATECAGEQCQRYYVASGGKDGKLERMPPSANGTQPRMMDGFDADIVYSNGQFVVSPTFE